MLPEAAGAYFYSLPTPTGPQEYLRLTVPDSTFKPTQLLHQNTENLLAQPSVRDANGVISQDGLLQPEAQHSLDMAAWRYSSMGRGTRTMNSATEVIDDYLQHSGDTDPRHRDVLETIATSAQQIATRRSGFGTLLQE